MANRMKEWASARLIVARIDLGERRLAHVPAADGPLVILLQEEGPHQPEQAAFVGEDADHFGPSNDLLV